MMTNLAAQAAEPNPGWDNLIALVLAATAFWVATEAHKRWKASRDTSSGTPSPAGELPVATSGKPQVKPGKASKTSGTVAVVEETPAAAGAKPPQTIDEFVSQRYGKQTTAQIVRDAKRILGTPQRTAYNAVQRAAKATKRN